MHYPDLATVQARLIYRVTSFLFINIVGAHTVEWMDAFNVQRYAADALKITERELPWLGTRIDPRGYQSFGLRMSRKIVCGDCGRPFGHNTWQSGTPNRVDVWECPRNYVKRGTCATNHLYQDVLLLKMTEALQVLAGRNSTTADTAWTAFARYVCATPINAPRRDRQTPDRAADTTHSPFPGLLRRAGGWLHAHRRQAWIRVHHRRGRHPRPAAPLEPRAPRGQPRSYRALLTGLAKIEQTLVT